jgi:hypothetical protein
MIILCFFDPLIKFVKPDNLVLEEKKPSRLIEFGGFLKKKWSTSFIRILNILKCLFWLPGRLLLKQSLKSKSIKKPMQW